MHWYHLRPADTNDARPNMKRRSEGAQFGEQLLSTPLDSFLVFSTEEAQLCVSQVQTPNEKLWYNRTFWDLFLRDHISTKLLIFDGIVSTMNLHR